MSFYNSPNRTFIAAEDLAYGIRVKLNGTTNQVAVAGVGDVGIGVVEVPVVSGASVSVRLYNSGGTVHMTASAAVAYGSSVYSAALGKVSTTSTGAVLVGTAVQAGTGAGSVIEVLLDQTLPLASASQAVATDLTTVVALANALRTALISKGIITGAA